LIGGIAGVTAEHIVGDTNGFEYVVRKTNGELVSVTQKEEKALPIGQKVLVIGGAQARIVADYTVPFEAPKAAAKPAGPAPADEASHQPGAADPPVPATIGSGAQIPAAVQGTFSGSGAAASQPPPIVGPSPPVSVEPKP
jgi:outer membrane lipoprotein SlyB